MSALSAATVHSASQALRINVDARDTAASRVLIWQDDMLYPSLARENLMARALIGRTTPPPPPAGGHTNT